MDNGRTRRFRVALLGCSRGPGEKHVMAWQATEQAEIVLLAERDGALAAELAGEYGIPEVCSDFREAAARDDIDIVDIALPPRLHGEAAVIALEAGRHVLCEKPMTETREEADRVVAAAAQSDRVFAVHFQQRFYAMFRRAAELIASGSIGRPVQWRYFLADGSKDRAPDTGYQGILADCGVHHIDFATLVFGRPVSVQAAGMKISHRPNLGVDTGTLVVTYESGDQMATHMCNGLLRGIKGAEVDEVFGPYGMISLLPPPERTWTDHITWTDRNLVTHRVEAGFDGDWNCYRQDLVTHFLACIRDPAKDRHPLAGAEDGWRMVQVNAAIEESLRTGEAVALTEPAPTH